MFTDSSTLPDQGVGRVPKDRDPVRSLERTSGPGPWSSHWDHGSEIREKKTYKLIPGLPPPLKKMVDPIAMIKTLM